MRLRILSVLPALLLLHCTTETIQKVGAEDPSGTEPEETFEAGSEPESETDGGKKPADGGKEAGKDAGKDGSTNPPADAGPDTSTLPPISGIGSSVAECNGNGIVSWYGVTKDTETWNVKTVWIYGTDSVSGTGNKIFGYTRAQIGSKVLPLAGTPEEMQIRLSIASPSATLTPGTQYQGAIALSKWNPAQNKWTTEAGSLVGAAIVTIESFSVSESAWTDGHFCAGKVVGKVEGLVDGSGNTERLDFYFVAPLLTPSFPN